VDDVGLLNVENFGEPHRGFAIPCVLEMPLQALDRGGLPVVAERPVIVVHRHAVYAHALEFVDRALLLVLKADHGHLMAALDERLREQRHRHFGAPDDLGRIERVNDQYFQG